MLRIKQFSGEYLERQVNIWLRTHEGKAEVVDLKYNTQFNNDGEITGSSVLILYRKIESHKILKRMYEGRD